VGVLLVILIGFPDRSQPLRTAGTPAAARPSSDIKQLRPRVEAFCGDCHAPPPPESFPRNAWYHEVERGYRFYLESQRNDLTPPPLADVVNFYRAQAPQELSLRRPPRNASQSPVSFTSTPLDPAAGGAPPATAFLRWLAGDNNQPGELVICDMRSGELRTAQPSPGNSSSAVLATLENPCHAEAVDLDGDGRQDLVVADLGSLLPEDHDRGRVVWLRRSAEGIWETRIVAQSLGRIADVRPADFDGDGDQDLVIAEFGWHKTGGIHWLENREGDFQATRLDSRTGAIHVPVCDLNQDGRLDFIALLSQEHESIVAFLNGGEGRFSSKTLWTAADPGFGSSGIEVVDLDHDGDLDVLYTNGDTLDSSYLKPSHGVHWLENRGALTFVAHRLAYLPGVHRALPGDMDRDGDLDILAVTFIAKPLLSPIDQRELDSMVLLQQTAPGEFAYHRLEQGKHEHATLELGDLDRDGDLDIAAGRYLEPAAPALPHAVIWWNQGNAANAGG
jgi:hypothetical protein